MEKTLHMITIIPVLFPRKYASATGQRLINTKKMWIEFDIYILQIDHL